MCGLDRELPGPDMSRPREALNPSPSTPGNLVCRLQRTNHCQAQPNWQEGQEGSLCDEVLLRAQREGLTHRLQPEAQ